MTDYETQYDNRGLVPDHARFIAAWAEDAAAYRAVASAELGVRYGPSPRQYYDLFRPEMMTADALAVFFHGGYAIHGTGSIRSLGRPASHGCVRLHPNNAAALYALVQKYGPRRTRITLTD